MRTRAKAILMTVAIFAVAMLARADEFDTLRLRWRDMLTQGTNASSSDPLYQSWISQVGSTANSFLNSMNTSPGRTFLWSTYNDLATDSSDITGTYQRLRAMALGYSVRDSSMEGHGGLRSAILDGLDWMHANHYNPTSVVFDNWFDFEIATPLLLDDIAVLLYDQLSGAQINNYMSSIEHFTPVPNLTSANKVWKAMAVTLRGVIVKDPAKIELGRSALSDVFPNVTSGDGFYADGSFIFHNYFPYAGGYGIQLLDTVGSMMQLLHGSTWQISDPQQTNVYRWVYDAYQPFLYKGAMMQMVDGRYHTRTGDDHIFGHDALGAILRLAQFAPTQDAAAFKSMAKAHIFADTYRNFVTSEIPPFDVWAKAVVNDSNIVALPETPRHYAFPSMDRVVHRQADWAFGLAMSSYRVANYESTRGENLRGWFTGDGMTYLYNSDLAHYADNFWSTIDPYRMPGTTVDVFTRTNGSGDGYRSPTNNQVGSASIHNLYGVAAMHLNSWGSTLSARKSWFMFDDEIVCLGNSVSSTDGRAAETIIENRRLGVYGNNALTVNGASKPSSPGWSETLVNPSWAHLAGTTAGSDIGYYFPSAASVNALRESRSGAMKDINTTYGSTTRNTRHYLTMWLEHGTNPSGGTYAYVLLPGKSTAQVASYAANPDITIVQNNSIASVVRENKLGITAANHWRDTSNLISGISFDRKAAAIWKNDGNVLEIGVSDPTQTNTGGINVELPHTASAVLSADAGVSVLQLTPMKLWFNTSNAYGATLRARFAVAPIYTNAINPVADAHVHNGASAVTNFGESSTMSVKLGGSNQTRETYLRFDLSAIPGTILDANLRLVTRSFFEPVYHAAAVVPDNSWAENGPSGITWNTKPASGPAQVTWLVTGNNQTLNVPLAALAKQAQDGDGKLSLRIFSTGTNGTGETSSSEFVNYGSRENSVANRPLLTVTYVRTPPAVTLTSPQDGTVLDAPGTVTLAAEAQDEDGNIASVTFYSGSIPIAQDFSAPFGAVTANLSPGAYAFTAVATDNSGLSATSAPVSVSVYAPEPVGRGTGLTAQYFSDKTLANPALTRIDTNVNFTWGVNTSPGPGVPNDFSVRWRGKLQPRFSGVHHFHTESDDGVRLWVDGKLIIDNWTVHLTTEDTGSIALVPGRYYEIVLEHFDNSASAVAKLSWTQPGMPREIIPTSQLYPAGHGLRGTYFSSTNLSGPVLTRIDDAINFIWNTNSPEPTLLNGSYGARWVGRLKTTTGGLYQFFTLSDDGVRLWINNQLVISNWSTHTATENSGSISLAAAQSYDLMMEYFNSGDVGTAVLMWQPPGGTKEIIPARQLAPTQNNQPPVLGLISNRVAQAGQQITFNASAVDADGDTLTYSLDAGAPVGAAIHPANGSFSWTASNSLPAGNYTFTVRVNDNGTPLMTDAQVFTVTILSSPTIGFQRSGASATVTWPQSAGGLQLFSTTNLTPPVTWSPVTNVPVLNNGQWSVPISAPPGGARFYRLQTP